MDPYYFRKGEEKGKSQIHRFVQLSLGELFEQGCWKVLEFGSGVLHAKLLEKSNSSQEMIKIKIDHHLYAKGY
jgi:hypothetical protein